MAQEHNNAKEKWMLSMQVMLDSTINRDVQAFSIPIVKSKLRKSREDAYKPKVVSIGPIHRGAKTELLYMEEPKWRYMMSLMGRSRAQVGENITVIQIFVECGQAILHLDEIVRASYVSKIEWNSYDLARITLLDGCFILELLIGSFEKDGENQDKGNEIHGTSGPAAKLRKNGNLLSDLLLLENQVPFFVLRKLSVLLFPERFTRENSEKKLAEMAPKLFGYSSDISDSGAAHLLQLVHTSITRESQDEKRHERKEANVELKHCATRLQARGVEIKAHGLVQRTSILLRMFEIVNRFVKRLRTMWAKKGEDSKPGHIESHMTWFDFGISFNEERGVLEIPPLRITETTEANWRNFIAWEQSSTDWRKSPDWDQDKDGINCKFTSYALFFRGLICCVHDIELLREKKIITVDNPKKGNQELLTLFHKITEGLEHMDSRYTEDCKELNEYSTTNPVKKWTLIKGHQLRCTVTNIIYLWKNWYGILKRDHMPTVWKTLGVLAAVLLLFLTISQTVLAALAL